MQIFGRGGQHEILSRNRNKDVITIANEADEGYGHRLQLATSTMKSRLPN